MRLPLSRSLLLVVLTGCGGGANVTYLELVAGTPGAASGPGCPTPSMYGTTLMNEGYASAAAILAAPNNVYLLDYQGQVLTGTLSSGTYTFSSVVTDQSKPGGAETDYIDTLTVKLQLSGNGVSGTVTDEAKVNPGMNSMATASDCTVITNVQGSVLSGVQPQTSL